MPVSSKWVWITIFQCLTYDVVSRVRRIKKKLSEDAFKNWFQEVPGKKTNAFCRVSGAEIRTHKNDLTKHADSVKHKKQVCYWTSATNNRKILFKKRKVSTFEILLSIHIACHASMRSVDHLTDLIKAHISGTFSINETIKIHHTKCSAFICKVIAPDIFETNL